MDDIEDVPHNVNVITCLKWVRRGMAKQSPEKVKLTQEELAGIIQKTRKEIEAIDEDGAEDEEDVDEHNKEDTKIKEEQDAEIKQEPDAEIKDGRDAEDRDIAKEYDLDNYDDDEQQAGDKLFGIGDLISDPTKDEYLANLDYDDDASDREDEEIRPTDNLILATHVEGDASVLEVYVYNDVEDALYVHHDILLPSFPLALEWLSYEPGEETKGSLVAVGTADPIIQVWDLDMVDGLEPAFTLGSKGSKKRKVKRVGHKDAVLSLAWNHHVEYVLASGSVDQTVMLWDMNEGSVKLTLRAHEEKVQALQWHPFEMHSLLTGCCDNRARVFDCRDEKSVKTWRTEGEVEKVVWNHFRPFQFLAATETGYLHTFDVRRENKPVWTLSAHSEGINGLGLSSQCPDCVVTVSSDESIKIWDISNDKPACVKEREMKLGKILCAELCPDAPFVVCVGGDNRADNFRVMDIRENAEVRSRFGNRKLVNPLQYADFGYATANEAEEAPENMDVEAAAAMQSMNIGQASGNGAASSSISGGAAGKFRKKDKKKKKKQN